MILKFFEIGKINLKKINLILLYGKNEGLKKQATNTIIKSSKNILRYDEKEILSNTDNFLEQIFSKSLFESEKFLIIKRASDKIIDIIKEINDKKIDDVKIIVDADNLEKRSKLRSLFEKDKELVCIAFYQDTEQTLSKLAYDYLRENNISMSSENINLVINRCNGDRLILLNELNKIKSIYPQKVSYVFGKGMIAAILFHKEDNAPDSEFASKVAEKCMQKGLLVVHTGRESIKIGPPLIISIEALKEGLSILEESIKEIYELN